MLVQEADGDLLMGSSGQSAIQWVGYNVIQNPGKIIPNRSHRKASSPIA